MDYDKLAADLKRAQEAALEAAKNTPDDGTCNLDCVFLELPGAQDRKVAEAFLKAGVSGYKYRWNFIRTTGYLISPPGHGQANARNAAMETMKSSLAAAGYKVMGYYRID